MRNLEIFHVQCAEKNFELDPKACCVLGKTTYLITKGKIHSIVENLVKQVCTLPDSTSDSVFFDSCINENQLVICTYSGELVQINSIDTNKAYYETVGTVEPGILAAKWDPAKDRLAIVTSEFNLIITQDLEPEYECELQGAEAELSVSVGWGKAETQFRGSAGKILADEVKDKRDCIIGNDDGQVRLSWREDGQLVVVSYLYEDIRQLRVVNNEGILLYKMEPIPGLESALCWKPSGSLIVSTLKTPNKHIVCFFEKNLLRHGGFELKDNNCIVKEIIWNCDSSVLALLICIKGKTAIQLFSVSNYHWYQKYTIDVVSSETVIYCDWDSEDPFTLLLVTINKDKLKILQQRWTWRWCVNKSSSASRDDQQWTAVIDGKQLLLTAFKQGIVPPPMCNASIIATTTINAVGFLQLAEAEDLHSSSNDFFIQTVDNKLSFYRFEFNNKTHVANDTIDYKGILFQFSWVATDTIIANQITPSGKYQRVVLCLKSNTMTTLDTDNPLPFTAARRIPGTNNVFLTDEKSNSIIDLKGYTLEESSDISAFPKILDLEFREGMKPFALHSTHCLSNGSVTLATNVTSFCLASTHLLATTMQHKLLCWRLDALNEEANERIVERGASIITHIRDTSSVVLQLPRGNLEVIQPRPLTISVLQRLIEALEFGKAFSIMRRERINLNLLHDHNPIRFEEHVGRFISDVSDPIFIGNFIAELSNENVTETLYSSFYQFPTDVQPGKVQHLCQLLLSELTDPKYLLSRLSCLVKKGNVEEAILLIKSLKDEEHRGEVAQVSSSEGLTHVLYLVDVESLFKVALGTYDLSLVMFIAGKSQKDPKEYIPFLANLQKMEENYQKFTIDNFIKRYDKALVHLSACPSRIKECLDYVVSHGLFREALRVFSVGTDSWKSVSVLYAEELTRLGRHEEAGAILRRAGEMVLAEHAYARAGAWRQQLACAETQAKAEDQKASLYNSIVETLRGSRRYTELARFCLDHTGDVVGGIEALIAARDFDEAIRNADLHQRSELVEQMVRRGAIEAASEIKQTLHTVVNDLTTNMQRLRQIQDERNSENLQDWDDSRSESSRGSSRISTRSAKNTRKLERNLMKRGGPFESVALVAAIHNSVVNVVSFKTQVRSLNLTLILLDEEHLASGLQALLLESLEKVDVIVKEVWQASVTEGTSNSAAAAFRNMPSQLPGPVLALQPKVQFAPDLCSGVDWQVDLLKTRK